MRYTKKDNPCDMCHFKKYVNDAFTKWDNIYFPVGNDEIDCGLVSAINLIWGTCVKRLDWSRTQRFLKTWGAERRRFVA